MFVIFLDLQYKCGGCNKMYNNRESLYVHRRVYCGKNPKYFCPMGNCDYKSFIKSNVQRHVSTKHAPKKCDLSVLFLQ